MFDGRKEEEKIESTAVVRGQIQSKCSVIFPVLTSSVYLQSPASKTKLLTVRADNNFSHTNPYRHNLKLTPCSRIKKPKSSGYHSERDYETYLPAFIHCKDKTEK